MKHSGGNHPPIISMIIGSKANRGIVIVSNSAYLGGIADIYWRTKIEVCKKGFTAFADEFYPIGKRELFQPEPGCSDPTFVGSGADVAGLSGIMLNLAAQQLSIGPKSSASAHLVTLPNIFSNNASDHANFIWHQYIVCNDSLNGYKIKITQEAWKQILMSIRESIRKNGSEVETGGLLFEKRDDISKIIWVSDTIGAPPDSIATKHGFICGIKGTAEAHEMRVKQTRGAVAYIGVWHTHPKSLPLPSEIDFIGMEKILTEGDLPPLKNLLLIVSMSSLEAAEALLGAFVFDKSIFTNAYVKVTIRKKNGHFKSSVRNPIRLVLRYFGVKQS
jgi:proteasome lid subunit RPN8/RPN11